MAATRSQGKHKANTYNEAQKAAAAIQRWVVLQLRAVPYNHAMQVVVRRICLQCSRQWLIFAAHAVAVLKHDLLPVKPQPQPHHTYPPPSP